MIRSKWLNCQLSQVELASNPTSLSSSRIAAIQTSVLAIKMELVFAMETLEAGWFSQVERNQIDVTTCKGLLGDFSYDSSPFVV